MMEGFNCLREVLSHLCFLWLMALKESDLGGQNDLLGNPYPERLSAREEDGFFKVEARAVLKEEGSSFLKSAASPKIKSA